MHELSIAIGIVKIAEKEVKKVNASRVSLIELEIGKLSGIELESLNFVWESAVRGTVLENAKKKINSPSGKAKCLDCGNNFELENLFDSCSKCNSHFKNIYHGKELRVKAVTIE